jgi:hypothetical protein
VFVTPHMNRTILWDIASYLSGSGIHNAIIVSFTTEALNVYSYDVFEPDVAKKLFRIDTNVVNEMFYDRFADLNQYQYRTIYLQEFPTAFTYQGKLMGLEVEMFKAIVKHQNARVLFLHVPNEWAKEKGLPYTFIKYKIDSLLNTNLVVTNSSFAFEFVNTFELNGFCAMLPHPNRKSLLLALIKPFDLWTWIAIVVTMICLMTVWYLLGKTTPNPNSDSAGYLLFSFVALFIGQGAEFGNHRLIQTILVQLMIFMTIILGNSYRSLLISLMAEPQYDARVETVSELLKMNISMNVDAAFHEIMRKSEEFKELKVAEIIYELKTLNYSELAANKTGIVLSCNKVDMLYQNIENLTEYDIGSAADFYYKVPEKLYTFYSKFLVGIDSPLTDRLQDYSLKLFESGVRQHWRSMITFEDIEKYKQRRLQEDEQLLKIEDLIGAFYYLGIGLGLASVGFAMELIVHQIWKMLERRRKPKQTGVRFIQVQPRV